MVSNRILKMLISKNIKTFTFEINVTDYDFDYGDNYYFVKRKNSPLERTIKDISYDDYIYKKLNEIYNNFMPDIIHLHRFRVDYSTIIKFIKDKKVPVVFTAHDADLICPISTLVRPGGIICDGGIKTRCMFTGCKTGLNVPYEIMRYHSFINNLSIIKMYLTPSDALTNYIRSFVDRDVETLRSFINFPEHFDNKSEGNAFGYIGRIVKEKGIQDVIKACKILKEKGIEFNFYIAGDGDYKNDLIEIVKKYDLDNNVHFLGSISGKSKEDFFSMINFSVLASLMFEHLPLSIAEGMVREIPAVANSIGGIPELIDDEVNGLLAKPYNYMDLANKIEYMLSNRYDLKELGGNGRKKVMDILNPEKHILKLINIYNSILN